MTRSILKWKPYFGSFYNIDNGNAPFVRNNCAHQNCFVVSEGDLDQPITDYDAILFQVEGMLFNDYQFLPKYRSPKQKYIFTAINPSQNYPICHEFYNNYFNWTWTFKLDSDIPWGYFKVLDMKGKIVGPKRDMVWQTDMKPIDIRLKRQLSSKSDLAALFLPHCFTENTRTKFVHELQTNLTELGDWSVHVFNECGEFKCARGTSACGKMLARDYFFYLAFENYIAEDFVTEKVVIALTNYVVPVVYGGANYSRFLPPGSYLNARKLGPKRLAEQMVYLMENQTAYQDFFRWTRYYQYSENTKDICTLCAMLNDDNAETYSSHANLIEWWNGNIVC
ncbi:hypothetical protein MSG28_012165 [Choristoneura fumiferana]|uniref:Uncharacterized protein n=1 Tax=Choristoneura fumiferana TaxID=7141 RepID=A0ACC0KC32_CHOFU|nr:hypothetical protein MSG28_012165 [Choristoneura fumiferana]